MGWYIDPGPVIVLFVLHESYVVIVVKAVSQS